MVAGEELVANDGGGIWVAVRGLTAVDAVAPTLNFAQATPAVDDQTGKMKI